MAETTEFKPSASLILMLMLLAIPWQAVAASDQAIPPSSQEAQAVQAGAGPELVRLEDLMKQMLAANPELQAARRRWEAMQKRPGQESALPDPNVRLGWASAGAPYPGAGLGSEPAANFGIEISQMFPFPGKRALRGAIAHQEARAESYQYLETERNLVSRLKSTYYELQFSFDAID